MSALARTRQEFLEYLLALCLLPLPLLAQEAGDADTNPIELDPLVVVASKSLRPLSEVAAQVTVIDAAAIGKGMVEDLDGMLKYEPGLDLESAGTRFGTAGITLRGIGGNRVVIEQDGIPLRDRFAVGAFSDAGRALVETDRIKRVEVLHGPASVLYGSNALGGVVAITTWDPTDLLERGSGSRLGRPEGGLSGRKLQLGGIRRRRHRLWCARPARRDYLPPGRATGQPGAGSNSG